MLRVSQCVNHRKDCFLKFSKFLRFLLFVALVFHWSVYMKMLFSYFLVNGFEQRRFIVEKCCLCLPKDWDLAFGLGCGVERNAIGDYVVRVKTKLLGKLVFERLIIIL